MASYLLDTNILIDVINGRQDAEALMRGLAKEEESLGCCAINIAEVYAGLRPQHQQRAEKLFSILTYYDITEETARKAGTLKYAWARKGVTLSLPDVIIAAVAIAENLTVITHNVKHFPMPELKLYPLPQVN